MFIKSDLALMLSTEQATPDLTLQCSAADHELNVFLVEQNRTNWSLSIVWLKSFLNYFVFS